MTLRLRTRLRRRRQAGIALLEVLIAIVLLGIGVLGTIGLQGRSYSALADTGMRAEATLAAEQLVGIATNDQPNLAAYALALGGKPSASLKPWYDDTVSRIPGAKIAVAVVAPAVTAPGQISVSIEWARTKGSASNKHTVTSYIAPSK
jgi:type IV pilus assembly protein PilV